MKENMFNNLLIGIIIGTFIQTIYDGWNGNGIMNLYYGLTCIFAFIVFLIINRKQKIEGKK